MPTTTDELKKDFDELKKDFDELKNQYVTDRKAVKWAFGWTMGALAAMLLAFFGITWVQLPEMIQKALTEEGVIQVKATIEAIKESVQITEGEIKEIKDQIEQLAINAGKDANVIRNLKENLIQESEALIFTDCGELYSCTPKACLAKCMELGMRMATYNEVYAWASAGKDHCAHMWMLDSKQSENPIRGYPMYHNQTTANTCGRINTGDIPRMEGVNSNFSWDSEERFGCACSSLK